MTVQTKQGIPMAPKQQEDSLSSTVVAHFTCPNCRNVPSDPVYLSPCEHVMCHGCVLSLAPPFLCPVCRLPSTPACVASFRHGGLLHRIWCDIQTHKLRMDANKESEETASDANKEPSNKHSHVKQGDESPRMLSITKTVHVETLNAALGLKIMLFGMVAGFAMHFVWPRKK